MKDCTNPCCTQDNPQPLSQFAKRKARAIGYAARCKTCLAEQVKQRRRDLLSEQAHVTHKVCTNLSCKHQGVLQPLSAFPSNRSMPTGTRPRCKTCMAEYHQYTKGNARITTKRQLRDRLRKAFRALSATGKTGSSRFYHIDYDAIFRHLGPCPGPRDQCHIDHIRPLCSFDFDDPEQVRQAFVPENHQWLLAVENMRKNAKIGS